MCAPPHNGRGVFGIKAGIVGAIAGLLSEEEADMDAKISDTSELAELRELLEKQKITECLYRYCRAIDRCDPELLKSVYHPEARDEHGMYSGTGWDFVGVVIPYLQKMGSTTHQISNILIDIKGDVANVESYCTAFHADVPDEKGALKDFIVGARYVDRFEKRDGEWKVAHRQCVFDWNQSLAKTGGWEGPLHGAFRPLGTKDKSDYSYGVSKFGGK